MIVDSAYGKSHKSRSSAYISLLIGVVLAALGVLGVLLTSRGLPISSCFSACLWSGRGVYRRRHIRAFRARFARKS